MAIATRVRPVTTQGPSEAGLSKLKAITELTRAPHGNLDEYLPVGTQAAREDPEWYAHLIAWNEKKGQVRDSKLALPVIQLADLKGQSGVPWHTTLRENALAHLALQSPRDLLRALKWAKEGAKVGHHTLARMVKRYIHEREKKVGWWDRTVLTHRKSMLSLYRYFRIKPSTRANDILFKGARPEGSPFEALATLSSMTSNDAAAAIVNHRLPFLSVMGALGGKITGDLGLAIIERMSPNELVTNSKLLERAGLSTNPAMRAAYEAKLAKPATKSSLKASLKTTRAAGVVGGKLGEKLKAQQERVLDTMAVKGNWAVLADKSASMQLAIEIARQVTGILARVADGETHLVFMDTTARYLNATKREYDWVNQQTSMVQAQGGTSLGVGLAYLLERGITEIDGIVVVSDAQENNPPAFAHMYTRLCGMIGKQPPVYLYRVEPGSRSYADVDLAQSMKTMGHELQEFDLRGMKVDYTSLPNLVLTMRANRYSLIDEVYGVPLLTLDDVFAVTRGYEVTQ